MLLNFSSYGLMQSSGNLVGSWVIWLSSEELTMHVQGPGDMLGLVSAEYVRYDLFDVCPYKLRPYIGRMRHPSGMSTLKDAPSKH